MKKDLKIKIINSIKESIKLKIIGNQTKTPKIWNKQLKVNLLSLKIN